MKRVFLSAAIFLILSASLVTAEEEIRLTTILPSSHVLRGSRGAIGPNYFSTNNLPDDVIENGHLYTETGVDVGPLYDNADTDHGAYMRSHVLPGMIRLAQWSGGYANGTTSGITGRMTLGVAYLESFEHLYFGIIHNLVWQNTGGTLGCRRITTGPGTFLWMGRQFQTEQAGYPLSDDPGLYLEIAADGGEGTDANVRAQPLQVRQDRVDIHTYGTGTPSFDTGCGLWVNSFPILYRKLSGGSNRICFRDANAIEREVASWPSSDISLKKEIVPIPDALDRLGSIRGVNFKWKTGEDTSLQTGVIAQEVEKAFPELVKTDEKGLKSVRYDEFAGILIEAVKSLKKNNDALRSRNNLLKNKIASLEKKHLN